MTKKKITLPLNSIVEVSWVIRWWWLPRKSKTWIITNRCDLTLKLKLSVLIYGDVVFNAISLEGACKITKSCQVPYEHIQTVHAAVPILSYIILTCQGWHWLPRRHFSYGRTNHCFSFPTCKRWQRWKGNKTCLPAVSTTLSSWVSRDTSTRRKTIAYCWLPGWETGRAPRTYLPRWYWSIATGGVMINAGGWGATSWLTLTHWRKFLHSSNICWVIWETKLEPLIQFGKTLPYI